MTMHLTGGLDVPLVVSGGASFIEGAEVDGRPLAELAGQYDVPECKVPCTIRYTFDVGRAGRSLRETDTASMGPGFFWANGPVMLLHPMFGDPRTELRFETSKDIVTALPEVVEGGPLHANLLDVERIPYIFAGATARVVRRDGVPVRIVSSPSLAPSRAQDFDKWVERSMNIVGSYYGKFPMGPVALGVVTIPGDETHFGLTRPGVGASIIVYLGERMNLDEDWVLVHEMIHLGCPTLPREYRWLEEGLATYVEPIAKSRVGLQSEEAAWADLVRHMPEGVAGKDAGALGETRSGDWLKMYWGGAVVMMLTDLEIRRRTDNRLGLEDGLRAVLEAGGNDGEHWSLEEFVAGMERVVPKGWLLAWLRHHHETPASFDLPALWKKLGIRPSGKTVTFDDTAPDARFRKEISRPRPPRH